MLGEQGFAILHSHMLAIMRDEDEPQERRMQMAAAAAPYLHPKLKQIEVSGRDNQPIDYAVNLTFS